MYDLRRLPCTLEALVMPYGFKGRCGWHYSKTRYWYGNVMTYQEHAGAAFKRQLHITRIVGVALVAVEVVLAEER